ncbi:MAG: DnaJ domain-containing protein [Clostridia bacterium]|nr:DnaJ domain-containing protein [Clostridia bacterium]
MKDPYEVLGVSRDATDEQIKAAYREKARKFHPDNFNGNPDAVEMATEKMKEINEAYDAIISRRKTGNNKKSGYANNWGANNTSADSNFNDVRQLIASGRFEEAQEILDGVPPERRDAEWYFLNGCVLYRRGWFDAAYTSMSAAVRMDPENAEYRAALNRMQQSRNGYTSYGRGYNGSACTCSPCDCCMGLMCADLCCNCF